MLPARSAVLLLLAAIAVSPVAWGQNPGGGGGGTAGGPRGGMGGGPSGPRPDGMRSAPAAETPLSFGALVQVQLDQLEDDLMLGPAQRGAWTAYADKVQKLADAIARSRFDARTTTPAPSSAPQQLDQIAGAVRGRASAVDEIVELGKVLYATLTPEQRAIADPRLAAPMSLLATGVAPAGVPDVGARSPRGRSP